MSLYIKLSSTLRQYAPGYDPEIGIILDFKPDTYMTAKDIAAKLRLPFAEIKFIMLNGRSMNLEAVIKDGDRLAFFPAVGGG